MPRSGTGFHANLAPTPGSVSSNSLHCEATKLALRSNDCAKAAELERTHKSRTNDAIRVVMNGQTSASKFGRDGGPCSSTALFNPFEVFAKVAIRQSGMADRQTVRRAGHFDVPRACDAGRQPAAR